MERWGRKSPPAERPKTTQPKEGEKTSVYKSRRKDAAAEFIAVARELRVTTMRIVRKFPVSYRWPLTNNLLELAGEIYTNCMKANAIYVHKDMREHDFELRHRYLVIAHSATEALLGEITFAYAIVDEGNNFLGSKAEYDRTFQRWTEVGNTALTKIRGVINSDTQRYRNFQKKKEETKE